MTRQVPNSYSGFLDLCRGEAQQNRIHRPLEPLDVSPKRSRRRLKAFSQFTPCPQRTCLEQHQKSCRRG